MRELAFLASPATDSCIQRIVSGLCFLPSRQALESGLRVRALPQALYNIRRYCVVLQHILVIHVSLL